MLHSKSIKKRAKTFFWASLFFSKSQQKDIAVLYSFCRYIDDISDSNEFDKTEAKKKLESIKKELKIFLVFFKFLLYFLKFIK